MLTTGKIIFAIVFVLMFIGGMFWAYRKDSSSNKIHFGGASKTLAIILLIFTIMILFVKLRHYF